MRVFFNGKEEPTVTLSQEELLIVAQGLILAACTYEDIALQSKGVDYDDYIIAEFGRKKEKALKMRRELLYFVE